jgi:hypothetical protein
LLQAKPFRKKLTSSEIKNYIIHKTEAIQNQFKELNITLMRKRHVERYTKKIKNCIAKKINGARNLRIVGRKESIDDCDH